MCGISLIYSAPTFVWRQLHIIEFTGTYFFRIGACIYVPIIIRQLGNKTCDIISLATYEESMKVLPKILYCQYNDTWLQLNLNIVNCFKLQNFYTTNLICGSSAFPI